MGGVNLAASSDSVCLHPLEFNHALITGVSSHHYSCRDNLTGDTDSNVAADRQLSPWLWTCMSTGKLSRPPLACLRVITAFQLSKGAFLSLQITLCSLFSDGKQ